MKKIYLSFLLTTHIISLSCMEKEKPRKHTNYEVQFPSVNPSAILPVHVLSMQPSIPTCQANQPGWERLDHIANMTYRSNQSQIMQPSITNEFELKPIYKPANTAVTQQEKKSLLQTHSLQPDETIMKELYKRAAVIVAAKYASTYSQKSINYALVALITTMNNAKNNGICEDLMGQFAYKEKREWNAYRHSVGYGTCHPYEKNIAPSVPIMFILLKKYNATVHQTGEQTPLHFAAPTYIKKGNIAFVNETNIGNDIIQYPAFFQLDYTLQRTFDVNSIPAIKTFLTYIYENNDISQEGYSDGSYKNLKNEFYENAYNYLLNDSSLENLYPLLQIIHKAKELREIHDENDLIAYITPENRPVKAQIISFFNSSHSDESIKNRITLLCKLIEKYNTTRDYKLTPTVAQLQAYYVKRFLNIPLPEPICNNAHLDDTFYAFEEFQQLGINTEKLIKLTVDEVNEQIKNLKK